jgi:hypothetical protein
MNRKTLWLIQNYLMSGCPWRKSFREVMKFFIKNFHEIRFRQGTLNEVNMYNLHQ